MQAIMVIIKKQLKDTLKNKTILIQFLLFPVMTLIMEQAITLEGMPELYFTKLFSIMYIGMAPITSISAIISEEKEKNTLRVLMMANVKPWQYLVGIGVYVWSICMVGACAMATGLSSDKIPFYLVFMGCGFMISIMAGACIGIIAKNQMAATSLAMPSMMILAFVPMLAMFNEKIANLSKFIYTEQLKRVLEAMSFDAMSRNSFVIIVINVVVLLALFTIAYKRKGLE